jgi:predicted RNA binding protein YcfA (HicA-like mRNA interferase family)
MARLTPLKPQEVISKLRKFGFEGPVGGGRHPKMFHPEKGTIIPIPMHKGKNVSVGIIREIISDIGISREEWLEL